MNIKSADFLVSSPRVEQCPQTDYPEYAFIGRSNVGKSSLINRLTGRQGLAKTSSMPGKTLLLNHFLINEEWAIVDLPGYGYARRSKQDRDKLRRMIEDYILKRAQLTCLFVLIDSRLTPQKIDVEFIHWLGENGVPFALVFTKADKSKPRALGTNVNTFLQGLREEWEELPPHFVTSAERGTGREELLQYIADINRSLKESD
ncbi:MAG: YihA family ribosome biogenesis GTP-binding protein [Alloprevotella sp.]|nr:YihA family ribosome biogenesis GTP-binding protein [Alloprevotella sp.]